MKYLLLSLLIFTAFLSLSCQTEVKSSLISPNERVAELPKRTPLPEKYEKVYLEDEDQPQLIKYQDYKIEKIKVEKKDVFVNPKAEFFAER